jgi:hypothetical protein
MHFCQKHHISHPTFLQHYPKTRKYISLYPPEARGAQTLPVDAPEKAKTDVKRDELRQWVREQMEQGNMASEPELELEKDEEVGRNASYVDPLKLDGKVQKKAGQVVDVTTFVEGAKGQGKDGLMKRIRKAEAKRTQDAKPLVVNDEFFESGPEEGSNEKDRRENNWDEGMKGRGLTDGDDSEGSDESE